MKKRDDSVIPLDEKTLLWLARLERITDTPMTTLAASLLRAIREDDESAHSVLH